MSARKEDQYISGSFSWFTGVVEDTNDISNLGRVRVRCFGYHTHDKGILPTESLPWATVMLPASSSGVQGYGTNHRLLSGSWVVGFFRDGPSAQDPLIMGSIASQTSSLPGQVDGFSGSYPTEIGLDMPVLARNNSTNTQVTATPGGHTIELDDTIDAEKIVVTHVSGSFIQLHQDGTITLDSSNDTILLNGNTIVTGTVRASDEITAKYIGEESVTLTGHTHAQTGGTTTDADSGVDTASPSAGS